MKINSLRNIVAADAGTTVSIRTKPGVLSMITIAKATAQTIAFYDQVDTVTPVAGNLLFTMKASIAEGTYHYNLALKKGLIAVVAGSYAGDAAVLHTAG